MQAPRLQALAKVDKQAPEKYRILAKLASQGMGAREIAATLGIPGAARAIGQANSINPLPVIIPCHRVVGADGSLTGYAGGLERKLLLLRLEGVDIARPGAR